LKEASRNPVQRRHHTIRASIAHNTNAREEGGGTCWKIGGKVLPLRFALVLNREKGKKKGER
jgi:hypothetical protein